MIALLKNDKGKRTDRLDAATILGDIGPDAKAAIPDLNLVAENDQYGTVKQAARSALAKIRRKH